VNWFVIGPTLASAFASAMSTTLEKAAANRATRAGQPRARLAGLGFDVIGIGLQVVALHYGALALVQPLLVSGLIFALILRHVGSSSRISARELLWGGALVACPTGFLFFSGATTGGSGSETADPSLLLPEA
jgi:hypothetical protein